MFPMLFIDVVAEIFPGEFCPENKLTIGDTPTSWIFKLVSFTIW